MEARIEQAGTTVNTWIIGDDQEVIVVDRLDREALVAAIRRASDDHRSSRRRGAQGPSWLVGNAARGRGGRPTTRP